MLIKRCLRLFSFLLFAASFCCLVFSADTGQPSISGPLRVHPHNPRYFTDGSGKAVYLTGSHTWSVFQDFSAGDPPKPFDYPAFLTFLADRNHNFTRLWVWEHSRGRRRGRDSFVHPLPFQRTGPGTALDGAAKFDLTQFNPDYFERLRSRVMTARDRGIYVAVMLFEGWSIENKTGGADDPWPGHPFNPANNVNGIDGDPNKDGSGSEVHTLKIPEITALQEAYVRKVIDSVNDLDNVLFEISNESGAFSTEWQYHMVELIKSEESKRPRQHPVGMTFQWAKTENGKNVDLFKSPADWISPNDEGGYKDNPPAAAGDKVLLSDTDHLWGIGGDSVWVWKSFLRGLNPIFMDPIERDTPGLVSARQAMGETRLYAQRMNLAAMAPRNDLSSTSYCLAAEGEEYLFFQPVTGPFHVFLPPGEYDLEWFNPAQNQGKPGKAIRGEGWIEFAPAFAGPAVLYLRRRR